MCLILFAVDPDDQHHLVVAANRDEQHERPTSEAAAWTDTPDVFGGRDLKAGGTWLGVNKNGRFAAVTNFAETPPPVEPPRSRGDLTAGFLQSELDPQTYLANINDRRDEYRGFNLLVSDGHTACYFSNRAPEVLVLEPGYYGLSNQLLNCDWPKVLRGKTQLHALATGNYPAASLMAMLNNRGTDQPHSGPFILGDHYGTCASSLVKMFNDGSCWFRERRYAPDGQITGESTYQL